MHIPNLYGKNCVLICCLPCRIYLPTCNTQHSIPYVFCLCTQNVDCRAVGTCGLRINIHTIIHVLYTFIYKNYRTGKTCNARYLIIPICLVKKLSYLTNVWRCNCKKLKKRQAHKYNQNNVVVHQRNGIIIIYPCMEWI